MNQLVRADSFFEVLIPFLVMIFWAIGQLATRKRNAPKRPVDGEKNRIPSTRPVSPEDDIRKFFEELNRKSGRAAKPAPEPEPTPPPVQAVDPRVRVVRRPEEKRAPVQAASDRMKAKQREIARAMATDTKGIERKPIPDRVAAGGKRSRRTMLNIRMPRISLPRIKGSAHDTALPRDRAHNPHRPNLWNRADLRRAILAKEILGKPKALDF